MPITTMKCGKCGGEMSMNPHPSAGNPDLYIEVGCQFECIPCLVKGRHELAVRASNLEKALKADATDLWGVTNAIKKEISSRMLEELAKNYEPGMDIYTNHETWYNMVKSKFPDAKVHFCKIPLKSTPTSITVDVDQLRKVQITPEKDKRYYKFYDTWTRTSLPPPNHVRNGK